MLDGFISLLCLSSPALPIGSYAWSQGLSSAIELNYIKDKKDLSLYLSALVNRSLHYWDLPLLNFMYKAICQDELLQLQNLDKLLKAGRETKELLEEEIQLGKSLLRLLRNLGLLPAKYQNLSLGFCASFALAYYLLTKLDFSYKNSSELLKAYSFAYVQNAITVACKCIPLGQSDGQEVLLEILSQVPNICDQALKLSLDEIGTSTPMLGILSALHEHQYVRIFRS